MNQSAQRIDTSESEPSSARPFKRLSLLRFLLRYPILFLIFGPPSFRPRTAYAGFDTSQSHFDIWSILQVGLVLLITLRAILRLTTAQSILIPVQIRSILRLIFFLGLLYLLSVTYSPGRIISLEFCILYFSTMVCVTEFIADLYRNPPDWVQCLFHLRFIAFLAFLVILLTLAYNPSLVMSFSPDGGIRLLGGGVGDTGMLAAVMAVISVYSFLYSLESRARSALFFLVGLTGVAITQWRGGEIALMLTFAILGVQWAKTSRHTAQIFISGLMAFILLAGVFTAAVGGKRIWDKFNRSQRDVSMATFLAASGRTEVIVSIIHYCETHPEGMGYVAGLRASRIEPGSSASMSASLKNVGFVDDAYARTLADAGWLALALYLAILAKTLALGWRFAKKRVSATLASEIGACHAIRCSLLLLIFCIVVGIDSDNFVTPLRQDFYLQNIIIAIILGASATMILASRTRLLLRRSDIS